MRVQIKTKRQVKDKDIRALYLIDHALSGQTDRMKLATLQFFADRLGMKVTPAERLGQGESTRL